MERFISKEASRKYVKTVFRESKEVNLCPEKGGKWSVFVHRHEWLPALTFPQPSVKAEGSWSSGKGLWWSVCCLQRSELLWFDVSDNSGFISRADSAESEAAPGGFQQHQPTNRCNRGGGEGVSHRERIRSASTPLHQHLDAVWGEPQLLSLAAEHS